MGVDRKEQQIRFRAKCTRPLPPINKAKRQGLSGQNFKKMQPDLQAGDRVTGRLMRWWATEKRQSGLGRWRILWLIELGVGTAKGHGELFPRIGGWGLYFCLALSPGPGAEAIAGSGPWS